MTAPPTPEGVEVQVDFTHRPSQLLVRIGEGPVIQVTRIEYDRERDTITLELSGAHIRRADLSRWCP